MGRLPGLPPSRPTASPTRPSVRPHDRLRVEQLVLDVDHRFVALQQGAQDRRRVVERRGGDDQEPRHAQEVLLEALAVGRPIPAVAARRHAHDHRAGDATGIHGGVLRHVVDDLVEGKRHEVAEHDLDDRPIAGHRQPGGDADHAGLADRGGQHPVRVSGRQAARDLEGAAVGIGDVLAQHDHPRIGLEEVVQGGIELSNQHQDSSRATISLSASSTSASTRARTSSGRRRPWMTSGSMVQRSAISVSGRLSSLLLWWQSR